MVLCAEMYAQDSLKPIVKTQDSMQIRHAIPVYAHLQAKAYPSAIAYALVHSITLGFGIQKSIELKNLKREVNERLLFRPATQVYDTSLPVFLKLESVYTSRILRNTSFGLFTLSCLHSALSSRNRASTAIGLQLPAKRAIASLAFPGLGQIQNNRIWKVPIIYAGLGVGGYFFNQMYSEYRRFQTLSVLLSAKKTTEIEAFYAQYSIQDKRDYSVLSVEQSRAFSAYYKRFVDNAVLAIIGIYAVQAVEALIDAHLQARPKLDDYPLESRLILPHFRYNAVYSAFEAGVKIQF